MTNIVSDVLVLSLYIMGPPACRESRKVILPYILSFSDKSFTFVQLINYFKTISVDYFLADLNLKLFPFCDVSIAFPIFNFRISVGTF